MTDTKLATILAGIEPALRKPGAAPPDKRVVLWVAAEVATTAEVAEHFGVSTRTVRRAISAVEDSPVLSRTGRPVMLALRSAEVAQ